MNKSILLFLALTLSTMTLVKASPVEPTKVAAVFKKVFVPGGFDSNDQVQIVGLGTFNNSCFRPADTSVLLDEGNKRIYLTPKAYEYAGICLQVILPFQKVVDVGILKPGTWDLYQEGSSTKLGQVQIHVAKTESSDDYLYAPVSQAFFYQDGSISNFTITGEFSNDCMQLDEVKITLEPDVVVLQPIAKMLSQAECKIGRFAFSKTVSVENIPAGRYLLHVRSLNGNAVNSLINIK